MNILSLCMHQQKTRNTKSECFFFSLKMVNGQWFIVSYDSANKQKHHKSHRMH